jgi:tRNA threonylcarbamoyladenosine biosynthesis protein TsaB
MLVLALDTSTRQGSAALVQASGLVEVERGDPRRTHGERLPGDLERLLHRCGFTLRDVDLFAVAAGPGSFTGLRIGIAAVQGLAFANGRPVVAVSGLDALREAADDAAPAQQARLIATWLDAQRAEVFAALYGSTGAVDAATVGTPARTLSRWQSQLQLDDVLFIGDGAIAYADAIRAAVPTARIMPTVPPLAPVIGRLAIERAAEATSPHAIRPIYVRRPDAELARERMLGHVMDH